ncbi:transcriptional regulator [Streptomyces mashuensis]|uniref:Transcriptional regulator n=1 Tax=Streptomyces mashuensis TaxID=33904 RepID=A0A919B527_9ACTN|nr:helix-turn-helix transcriptional regulator [Streptomyces mashuensis]GHF50442.1 transcriptional regulator [Streptomyces mashuensis]
MPPRSTPTARQQRLGAELRKMREQAGMTAPEAAAELGTNRTGISNLEAGRFGISAERVRMLASIYRCVDQEYVEALVQMARERGAGWWEHYRGSIPSGALDVAELEHHACGIRSMQIMYIPGLLQTEDYAKAVLSTAVPPRSATEVRRRVSLRMRRRDVLDRETPPTCTFLIHEAATRMRFGGPDVARKQLEHVLEESERDNISVRVIPFVAGGFASGGSSVLYVEGPVARLDTVHLDVASGGTLLYAESQLACFRAILDAAEAISLSPSATRDFIRTVAKEL